MRDLKEELKPQITIRKNKMDTNFDILETTNSTQLTTTEVDSDIKNKLSSNSLTNQIESIKLNALTNKQEIELSSDVDSDTTNEVTTKNENNLHQQSKIEVAHSSDVNLSNLVNKNECDIKSDISSKLFNLNLSKSKEQTAIDNCENIVVESKKNNYITIEGIMIPPQPLHPDTYLNFPHYIDYNNFSTNYNNPSQIAASAYKTILNKNASSSALALHTNNKNSTAINITTTTVTATTTTTTTTTNCNESLSLTIASATTSEIADTLVTNTTNTVQASIINEENHQLNSSKINPTDFNKRIKESRIITSPKSKIPIGIKKSLIITNELSHDVTVATTSISLTNQSSINNNMQRCAFIQNEIKPIPNPALQNFPASTLAVPPSISVTIHPSSQFPTQIQCNNISSNRHLDTSSCSNPFYSANSASACANNFKMQKCTSHQLNAFNASNVSTPQQFPDYLLAYKRYLFSSKTQSLDLGSDLEHPAVMRNRNPRLQQEELYYDDALTSNNDDELMIENQNNVKSDPTLHSAKINVPGTTSTNGDLRRDLLQKNADEAISADRLSPSPISQTISSTVSTTESDGASCNTTTSSLTDSSSSINSTSTLIPKLQTALESRPIYPNVPYSPYSSPRSRRRPPLRESRRVSIDKSGSFLQLNQYKLMDQIGQGSYGLVKLAYNEEDSTHYAMKILSKRRLLRKAGLMSRIPKKTTQSPLDRVYREIAVLKKLDHPNVVKLIEVLDDPLEDFLYLVFELVHQGEVLSIPTDKPLNEERAWSVFRDALQGLEYLHYQRIIHSDIKPGNLLLGECGQVKIADLGVCNEFLGEDAFMNNGSTAGTPAFRAPETLMIGQHIYSGKAVDIWALGATLWSLIYGNVPFVANNIPALYEQIKNDPLKFPEIPNICDELKDLLEKFLDKDASKRITLPQIKEHPWVTSNGKYPLPSEEDNCRLVQVSDEDMTSVVKSIPKLDTLILIKTMLKNHSFQNPFIKGGVSGRAPQRGGSRWERFTRAGRSNSAPDAYHSPLDRQLSSENTLPSLSENVSSPSNESSEILE